VADSFYASIEPVDSFERLALSASYRTLPDGWSLVAADVVDGSLRLVLSGTSAQRAALERYLAELRDAGRVAYGLHVARSALMTCLIEERQGAHFHFVDASGGGYAAAALALKRGG
jgi:hypothetical protein